MIEPREPRSWPALAYRILTGAWWPLVRAVLVLAVLVALGVTTMLLLDALHLRIGPIEIERMPEVHP
ncbi:hypothetical protein SAMN05192558_104206 [Actinokineospora alba]|uniref:Uncharacterized protein n=1 Tax=Actinokineospora alba TaxID=504798 RepID=A0A1H0LMR2_9PSEU|nr:hypothetical protein [Actinokineospora alba]TDP67382.1 hypothetical protein C8E96_2924 [Actinokineospora alba]SDI98277.1 hypothetical protein SAMN05421871_10991 [Actinokineospora alba]SDO69434.1 hypothetical protein SAMN05192558_104206 [Actinokineospora alba]